MKIFSKSALAMAVLSVALFSCESNKVAPEANKGQAPTISGAAGDDHPVLDSVCTAITRLDLISESTGSLTIDKCNATGGMISCQTTTSWGYIEYYNGIDFVDGIFNNLNDNEYLVVNFGTAAGWYFDAANTGIGAATNFTFNNNIPNIANDWFANDVDPYANKFQWRIPSYELPSLGYDIAVRAAVVKLNIFSAVIPNSATLLWAYNPGYNDPASATYNNVSPFLIHFTPESCLPPVVVNETNTVTTGECRGCRSEVSVEFHNCDTVNVSSCKDLSNVVLGFDDCTTYKFDNLSGKTGTYAAPAGKKIVTVWVKSGCFQSGDGPGFGWRVDNPNTCAAGTTCSSFSH